MQAGQSDRTDTICQTTVNTNAMPRTAVRHGGEPQTLTTTVSGQKQHAAMERHQRSPQQVAGAEENYPQGWVCCGQLPMAWAGNTTSTLSLNPCRRLAMGFLVCHGSISALADGPCRPRIPWDRHHVAVIPARARGEKAWRA